jgi:hypothetical protein
MFEIEDFVFIAFVTSALTGIGAFFVYITRKCLGGTKTPKEETVELQEPASSPIPKKRNPTKLADKVVARVVRSFQESLVDLMLDGNTTITPGKCMSLLRKTSLVERRALRHSY